MRERASSFGSLSATERLKGAVERKQLSLESRLKSNIQLLDSLSYERVLDRGYALIRNEKGDPIMRSIETRPLQNVTIGFSDGTVSATINEDKLSSKKEASSPKRSKRRSVKTEKSRSLSRSDQGSLF